MNEKFGSTSTSSNVKAGQAKIHRVVIEAREQPGTNLWGTRSAQDILELREPQFILRLIVYAKRPLENKLCVRN